MALPVPVHSTVQLPIGFEKSRRCYSSEPVIIGVFIPLDYRYNETHEHLTSIQYFHAVEVISIICNVNEAK